MKELIIEIRNWIQKHVPEVKYIAVYNGQFDHLESGDNWIMGLPAVFIELQSNSINQLGRFAEQLDLQVTLHIAHEFYNGDRMDENLEVFDLKQKIYLHMKNFRGDKTASFTRTSELQDFNSNNVYHFTQTYETSITDDSASPNTIEHQSSYNINATY